MNRIAVITDIHGNLPALEASLARDRRDRRRRDLLRRGSRRLRPAPQRGLRADRGARDPDDLRQLRLRDRPRPGRLRLRVRHPARPRARAAVGRVDARAHRPARRRTSCASCRSICTSRSVTSDVHLVHGSPRKVNEYLFEDKPASLVRAARRGRGGAGAGVRAHPQAVDPHLRRGAVRQLRVGRQAQGRRPARRVRDPRGRRRTAESRRRSSASPTTPRRSPARSRRPACRASTPTKLVAAA